MADFEVAGVIVDKDYVVLTLVFAEIRRYFLERAIRQLRVDEGLVTLRWLLLFAKLAVLDDLDDLLCDTRPPDVVGRSFSALGDAKVTIMDTVEDVFSQCRGYDDTTTFQEHTLADAQFVSDGEEFSDSRLHLTDLCRPSCCCVGHGCTQDSVLSCVFGDLFQSLVCDRPCVSHHVDVRRDVFLQRSPAE